jgi:membrane protein implicated in regulation of membrane protease activity
MCAYWSGKKDALWLIFLLFFGLPLLAMFMAIVLPLLHNHPVIFAGILVIILALLVVYLVKRIRKHDVKKS